MISFTRLGNHGQLGNQMFQYAVVKAVCARRGYEARFPRPEGLPLTEVFDIREPELTPEDASKLVHVYREPHFAFSDAVFSIEDDTDLVGYFQSEKYFAHIAQELRESLAFTRVVTSTADAAARPLFRRGLFKATTVSLHVRRGDYLSLPEHHPLASMEYYHRALAMMEERFGRLSVLVFSDDIEWCRATFTGRRYRFSTTEDRGADLLLMSRCDHHIIANSSFSWWGAWLNPSADKVVLAPAKWFGPECPQDDYDLLPAGWRRI